MYDPTMTGTTIYGTYDRDPRSKTHPCHYCARDVEAGDHCICIVTARRQPKEKTE